MTLYLVIIQPQKQSETFCAVAENDSTWSSSTQIKSGETIGQMEKGNATSWGDKRGERKSGGGEAKAGEKHQGSRHSYWRMR